MHRTDLRYGKPYCSDCLANGLRRSETSRDVGDGFTGFSE
jgi:hypothetical protein